MRLAPGFIRLWIGRRRMEQKGSGRCLLMNYMFDTKWLRPGVNRHLPCRIYPDPYWIFSWSTSWSQSRVKCKMTTPKVAPTACWYPTSTNLLAIYQERQQPNSEAAGVVLFLLLLSLNNSKTKLMPGYCTSSSFPDPSLQLFQTPRLTFNCRSTLI